MFTWKPSRHGMACRLFAAGHARGPMQHVPGTTSAGQTLAQYALALGIIATVALVALVLLGGQTSHVLNTVSGSV